MAINADRASDDECVRATARQAADRSGNPSVEAITGRSFVDLKGGGVWPDGFV
jgi:hypothetical protein